MIRSEENRANNNHEVRSFWLRRLTMHSCYHFLLCFASYAMNWITSCWSLSVRRNGLSRAEEKNDMWCYIIYCAQWSTTSILYVSTTDYKNGLLYIGTRIIFHFSLSIYSFFCHSSTSLYHFIIFAEFSTLQCVAFSLHLRPINKQRAMRIAIRHNKLTHKVIDV